MCKLICYAAGASTEGLPPGVLYRVRATYKYTREDVDEISFEVGEVINVVEYDDPEEQVSGVAAQNTHTHMHHFSMTLIMQICFTNISFLHN